MIELLYSLTNNILLSLIIGLFIYICVFFELSQLFKYQKSQLKIVATILSFVTGFLLGSFTSLSLTAIGYIGAAVGLLGGALIYGGIALAISNSGKTASGLNSSPTYSAGATQTQTNNKLPLPMAYGEIKVAGNRIYQGDNTTGNIRRLVGFSYGEIQDFTDIRLNDIPTSDIAGISVQKYYGTSSQTISTFVTEGSTNAQRAEYVGGLKNLAYLAISVPASDRISGDYNLTTVLQGRKIKVYTDEDTYTTVYSNNPVWVCLDLLTDYNGQRIGLDENGAFDNDLLKEQIDIDSFIEAAEYCDEEITYYKLTTALSGDNNDLIWVGRHSNRELTLQYTSGAEAGIDLTDDDILVTFVTGTTTADDIISLVASTPELSSVVNVYNADGNDGTGYVSTLAKTNFVIDTTEKRFEFNFIFDSTWLVRDAIEEIKKACRGALVNKGRKLQFKIDKPEITSKAFTKNDIIQGSESVKTLPKEQRYDMIDVLYTDPNYEWDEVAARAELQTYFNETPIRHEVSIRGITSFRQASRLAWYYLNRNIRCYFTGQFATDYRASDLEIGNVITLSDFVMDFDALPVKVVKIEDDNSGIFVVSWVQYDEDIYTDELGSLEPTVIVTDINNPYAFPSDITSFSATQNLNIVEFAWAEVSDINVTYEIREGTSWASSTLIATNIIGNNYSANLTSKGIFTYWIKARTIFNYSENAISDILNVQYLPNLNIVVSENIFEGTGEHTNTYLYNNKLKLNPTTLWQDISPIKWLNEGSRYYADRNGNWGSNVETSGVYISDTYDIGAVLTSIVSYSYNFYTNDISQTILIEWAYSDDNITWSDYRILSIGSYSFRYYKIKITITNPTGDFLYVSDLKINIDVPDREENYTNREITTAADGVTITYSTDLESRQATGFIITEPHVLATPLSNNTYPVVTSSTSSSCTIKLYTNTGNLTTGFVSIRARGY